MVKVVHPDRGGDAVMFGILTESFDVLSDPVQRLAYDQQLLASRHEAAVDEPLPPPTPHEPLSTFDRIVLASYKEHEPSGPSAVEGCLTDFIVLRFVSVPLFLVGIAFFIVPFWPVQLLGIPVALLAMSLPFVVRHGARTTRRKEAEQEGRPPRS